MLAAYARWCTAQALLGRPPLRRANGITFGQFVTFSEYWGRHKGPSPTDLAVLRRCRPSGLNLPVAIDVGANLGLFSLALSQAGYAVHAFEPIPDTYLRLQRNLRLNPELAGGITSNQAGVGCSPGSLTFAINEKSPGQNRIATPDGDSQGITAHCECPVTTLDAYFAAENIDEAQFLKIDVEGYEVDVLRGAEAVLKAKRIQFIYAEVIPQALCEAGSSVSELDELLRSFHYSPVIVPERPKATWEPAPIESALAAAGETRNVLFQRQNS